MSDATAGVIRELVTEYPDLSGLLREHVEDNHGEILPHLFMADVVRWLATRATSAPSQCRAILDWMERRFNTGPEDVRGLIAVSGVEMIPDPGLPGSELRAWLGPSLRSVDPWDQT